MAVTLSPVWVLARFSEVTFSRAPSRSPFLAIFKLFDARVKCLIFLLLLKVLQEKHDAKAYVLGKPNYGKYSLLENPKGMFFGQVCIVHLQGLKVLHNCAHQERGH